MASSDQTSGGGSRLGSATAGLGLVALGAAASAGIMRAAGGLSVESAGLAVVAQLAGLLGLAVAGSAADPTRPLRMTLVIGAAVSAMVLLLEPWAPAGREALAARLQETMLCVALIAAVTMQRWPLVAVAMIAVNFGLSASWLFTSLAFLTVSHAGHGDVSESLGYLAASFPSAAWLAALWHGRPLRRRTTTTE